MNDILGSAVVNKVDPFTVALIEHPGPSARNSDYVIAMMFCQSWNPGARHDFPTQYLLVRTITCTYLAKG
jgi:hypothetical protein